LVGDGGAGDKPGCGAERRKEIAMLKHTDIAVAHHGSLVLLQPLNDNAAEWLLGVTRSFVGCGRSAMRQGNDSLSTTRENSPIGRGFRRILVTPHVVIPEFT
jgi:hypothetical protein